MNGRCIRLVLTVTVLVMAGMTLLPAIAPCQQDERLPLHFFFTPGCGHCREVREYVVLPLVEKHPEIDYHEYDLADADGTERLVEFLINYAVPEKLWGGASAAFVGDLYYIGTEEIEQKLPRAVERLLEEGWEVPEDWKPTDARSRLVGIFDRFGVPAVAAAGLADGVNPCALAALVFLLSLLAASGRSSGEILGTGLLFAVGVFIAYFGVGFGIFKGLQALTGFELAAEILYPAAAFGTLILTILTFRDYRRAKLGTPEDISLKLPKLLVKSEHAVTRRLLRGRWFLLLAVIAGAAVSLLELFCTGQIYLPTLVYLSGRGMLLPKVVPMLLIYVAMFTLPVVVLTLAVWGGVSSGRLREWARKHTATSKLLMTIVFALLTVALIAVSWNDLLAVGNCCG